jgi:hypothetical protein
MWWHHPTEVRNLAGELEILHSFQFKDGKCWQVDLLLEVIQVELISEGHPFAAAFRCQVIHCDTNQRTVLSLSPRDGTMMAQRSQV